ncbi:hypothetical protein [Acinetobacter baumannii]
MTNEIEETIQNFGGFGKALQYLEELKKIPMHEQTEDTICWLPEALLEYRKLHNIFMVGDYFVLNDPAYHDDVECMTEDIFLSHWIHLVPIRHATNEERKANRRLDNGEVSA